MQTTEPSGWVENYGYDANGNLLKATGPSGTTSYTANAQDELTSVQTPTGVSVQFGYDAFGRMVSRTDGGGNTAYFYDGSNVLLAHPTHGTTFLASEYLPSAGWQNAGGFFLIEALHLATVCR